MKKRIVSILCAIAIVLTAFPVSVFAVSSGLIATNIPKTFPVVKQDPSATLITFWSPMTGNNAVLVSNITNWFNSTTGKKKKIYVKYIFQGDYDSIAMKVQATIQTQNAKALPDLAMLTPQGAFALKESKYMLYLDDLMSADKTFKIKDKLNKNAMAACSYKGKQMGLPFANSAIVLHYNVDAFKSVGLDPNDPPKTFAELATYCQKLAIKGTGKRLKRYGIAYKLNNTNCATWISRMGDGKTYTQFDMDEGRSGTPTKLVCAENGTLKTLFTEWKKVVDTGAVNINPSSPTSDFETGATAMFFESMMQYSTIQNYFKGNKAKAFENKMASLPNISASDKGKSSHVGGSAIYLFNKNDSVAKAATWEFVKFLASADVAAYWATNSGYYALNDDALKTQVMQNYWKNYPNTKIIYTLRQDSLMNTKAQAPMIPNSSLYSNCMSDQVALYLQGKQNVDTTIKNIVKKVDSILATWRKANG